MYKQGLVAFIFCMLLCSKAHAGPINYDIYGPSEAEQRQQWEQNNSPYKFNKQMPPSFGVPGFSNPNTRQYIYQIRSHPFAPLIPNPIYSNYHFWNNTIKDQKVRYW